MGQIEMFHISTECKQMTDAENWMVWYRTVWSFNCVLTNDWCLIELLVIHSNTIELLEIKLIDHLTVCIYKMCLQIIYLLYM